MNAFLQDDRLDFSGVHLAGENWGLASVFCGSQHQLSTDQKIRTLEKEDVQLSFQCIDLIGQEAADADWPG